MAREILFKAKRLDNGEWIEGHYYSQVYYKDTIDEEWYHFIKPIGAEGWEKVRIDPLTLCQYTGLTDENGNKIWENDILHTFDMTEEDYIVVWSNEKGTYVIADILTHKEHDDLVSEVLAEGGLHPMIIGNIFDNPELLQNNDLAEV